MNHDIYQGRLYQSKWAKDPYKIYPSAREANIILQSELDVIRFLRSRIVEDVADCAQNKQYDIFQFIMQRNKFSFSQMIRHNFDLCKAPKACEWDWAQRYKLKTLSSLPSNYKIYAIEESVLQDVVVEKQTPTTWHKFFRKCKELGLEQECIYQEMK